MAATRRRGRGDSLRRPRGSLSPPGGRAGNACASLADRMSTDALIRIGEGREDPPDGLTWQQRLDRLRGELAALGSVVIAYSGGGDSSLLLRVAHEVLGSRAL